MKLEIFVVTTEIKKESEQRAKIDYESDYNFGESENYKKLEQCKTNLTELFSGLTIIPNCFGLWLNDNKQVENDSIDIWLIYTTNNAYLKNKTKFQKLLNEIKDITQQTTQACAIDTKIYFL